MSMIARFVQIAPARLAEILLDPSSVIDLFESYEETQDPPAGFSDTIRDGARGLVPRALLDSLDAMDPAAREFMLRRMQAQGIGTGALESAAGVDGAHGLLAPGAAHSESGSAGRSSPLAPMLALEKSWHGLHYLLCGEVEPGPTVLSQAVIGGLELGDDYGYGPARYFTPSQVDAVARELHRANLEAEMKSRFNARRMSSLDVYPRGWTPADAAWLLNEFRRLRDFYDEASTRQRAVVTCIL